MFARRFLVSGLVQGVGYRIFAVGAAARIGVTGYVRNLGDGRVEVFAMGSAEHLELLRDELRAGPRFASVADVIEEPAVRDERFAHDFQIAPDH